MAMLAERKRKVKWSLNPRGKQWSEDSNKFGQKLLEKMGWSSGKGLGVNESGITEHIKVSFKNDSQGIGYKDRDDQWTQHEDQFNSLLSSLNGDKYIKTETDENSSCNGLGFEKKEKVVTISKDLSGESLEDKSKKSKARVHYKKFTRGKDVSKYSEKDLANIFGKKIENTISGQENIQTSAEKIMQQELDVSKNDLSFGITTTESKLSITEYFKSKMPNKVNKYTIGSDGVLKSVKAGKEPCYEEIDTFRPSFNLYDEIEPNNEAENNKSADTKTPENNIKLINKENDESAQENYIIIKNKKSKLDESKINNETEKNLDISESIKFKKSKRRKETQMHTESDVSNDLVLKNTDNVKESFITSESSKKKKIKHADNNLEYEDTEPKKHLLQISESSQSAQDTAENSSAVKLKKKKKKNSSLDEVAIQDAECIVNNVNVNISQVSREISITKKKKSNKNKKPKKLNDNVEINTENVTESKTEPEYKEKINDKIEELYNRESTEFPLKKSKKRKHKTDENLEFTSKSLTTSLEQTIENNNDSEVVIKKKKKKVDKSENALETQDNELEPNKNLNQEIEGEKSLDTFCKESEPNKNLNQEIKKKKLNKIHKFGDKKKFNYKKNGWPAKSDHIDGNVFVKRQKAHLEKKKIKEKLKKLQKEEGTFISKSAFSGSNFLRLPGYY